LLLAAALCLGATSARAHTSYLLPSAFATQGDVVTVQASFAEQFFMPEIAVLSDDYHVVRPDGARDSFDTVQAFRQLTILESDVKEAGTYRFTTGVRLGRIATSVEVKGKWTPLEPGQVAPKGAKTQTSQTETIADVYVSKGAPTRAAVDKPLGRLVVHPITHPNEIYQAEGFALEVLFDGAPLAEQDIVLSRASYSDPRLEQTIKTDAQGRATLRFDQPGAYVLMTRHRAPSPPGAQTPVRSYTTSLTFEVAP
jgi:uncharacterized GH25 family protein